MPTFAYTAVDRTGAKRRGSESASSSSALTRVLTSRGLTVLDVAARQAVAPRSQRVNQTELLEFMRTLAALLQASMPLSRALSAASHAASPAMEPVLGELRAEVSRGGSLAAAMAVHSGAFSPIQVGLVRSAERTGDLAGAFDRITQQLEREAALRGRLLSALIYPTLLAFAGAVSVVILVGFVLPRFAEMLIDTGAALPTSTALLLRASSFARANWILVLGVPIVLAAALSSWVAAAESGRRAFAMTMSYVPLVRQLRSQSLAARFARLLGTLLSGGAPLLSALETTAASIADPLAHDDVQRVRLRVREGATLCATLRESAVYPELLAQLVAVGEESGRLAEFLLKAADLFEERLDRSRQRLVTFVEPALIVFFGGLVGFIALSLLQAVYGVNAQALR